MSHEIIAFETSVSNDKGIFKAGTVYHIAQIPPLIGFPLSNKDCVRISVLEQIIHSIQMKQAVCGLTIGTREIGVRVIRIRRDLNIGAICGK